MLNENPGQPMLEPAPEPTPQVNVGNNAAPDLGLPIKTPELDKKQPSFEFNKKKKGKIKVFLIIALVILVICGGGYFAYTKVYSPQSIFKKVITKATKNVNNLLTGVESNEYYSKAMTANSVVAKGTLDQDKGYTTDYELALDLDNEVAYMTTAFIEETKTLASLTTAYQDNYTFRFLEGYLDKPIRYNEEFSFSDITSGLSTGDLEGLSDNDVAKDMSVVIQKLSDIFVDALDDLKYENSSEEIEIGDEIVKVNKTSIVLNEENLQILLDAFVKGVTEDDELLKIAVEYANLYGLEIDKKDLIKQIEDFGEDADLSDIEEGTALNIYTDGLLKNFVKFEFVVEDETVFFYSDYEDITTYCAMSDEVDSGYALVIDNTEDESTYALSVEGKDYVTGTVKEFDLENNNIDLTFKLNSDNVGIAGSGSIKMNESDITLVINIEQYLDINLDLKKVSDNKYNVTFEGNIFGETYNVTGTIEIGAKVTKKTVTDYYETTAITEVMQGTIADSIMANIAGTEFETEVKTLAGWTDLKTYIITELQDRLYLDQEVIIEDKNYEEVYDENHHSIFDAAQCDNVYDDGYGNWYNYDNDGTYEYVGKGEMIDSICQYNNSY
ncbi:MAG TPA: hypothetical protein PK737_02065 [Bacilli bacterium]|nr:hypothetical protein [Bacilli bacterium]